MNLPPNLDPPQVPQKMTFAQAAELAAGGLVARAVARGLARLPGDGLPWQKRQPAESKRPGATRAGLCVINGPSEGKTVQEAPQAAREAEATVPETSEEWVARMEAAALAKKLMAEGIEALREDR